MNPVLEAIHQRRSVRSFQFNPVPREMLLAIIRAGNEAPSGMNSQPWRFVIVEDAGLKRMLVDTAVPNAKRYVEPLREANPERYKMIMRRYEELEDPIYYSAPALIFVIGSGGHAADSCPLACENMMLAAQSLGLGSIWVKFGSMVTDNPEIVRALELAPGESIYGPIAIGFAKDVPEAPPKKDAVIKWI
jgi:nitroreductase